MLQCYSRRRSLQRAHYKIQEFGQLQKAKSKKDAEAAAGAYQSALFYMLGLTACAVVLGCMTAWFITRSITRPMAQAVAIAKTVAAGDLSGHIEVNFEVNSKDETGQLLQALTSHFWAPS